MKAQGKTQTHIGQTVKRELTSSYKEAKTQQAINQSANNQQGP
jgi:hypothetical protein